jgi:hypothetical protein
METITGLICVALYQNGKKQKKSVKSTGMAGKGKSSPGGKGYLHPVTFAGQV